MQWVVSLVAKVFFWIIERAAIYTKGRQDQLRKDSDLGRDLAEKAWRDLAESRADQSHPPLYRVRNDAKTIEQATASPDSRGVSTHSISNANTMQRELSEDKPRDRGLRANSRPGSIRNLKRASTAKKEPS